MKVLKSSCFFFNNIPITIQKDKQPHNQFQFFFKIPQSEKFLERTPQSEKFLERTMHDHHRSVV